MQKQGLNAVQSAAERLRPGLHHEERGRCSRARSSARSSSPSRQQPQIPEIKKLFEWTGEDRQGPSRSRAHRRRMALARPSSYTGPRARRTRVLAAEGHRRPEHADRLHRQRLHPADRLDEGAQRPHDQPERARHRRVRATSRRSKTGKFVAVFERAGQAVGVLQPDGDPRRSTTRRTRASCPRVRTDSRRPARAADPGAQRVVTRC